MAPPAATPQVNAKATANDFCFACGYRFIDPVTACPECGFGVEPHATTPASWLDLLRWPCRRRSRRLTELRRPLPERGGNRFVTLTRACTAAFGGLLTTALIRIVDGEPLAPRVWITAFHGIGSSVIWWGCLGFLATGLRLPIRDHDPGPIRRGIRHLDIHLRLRLFVAALGGSIAGFLPIAVAASCEGAVNGWSEGHTFTLGVACVVGLLSLLYAPLTLAALFLPLRWRGRTAAGLSRLSRREEINEFTALIAFALTVLLGHLALRFIDTAVWLRQLPQ